MLPYDHIVYKELMQFFNTCTGRQIPTYNGLMMNKPPKDAERLEFRLLNFHSTGQIYETKDLLGANAFRVGTISEYRCQLSIRIFEDPKNCALLTGKIAGAIQTFQYLEQFVDVLYIENETMRILPFTIQKDNTVLNFQEIIVDCYVPIVFWGDVDYFTTLEDFDIQINTNRRN